MRTHTHTQATERLQRGNLGATSVLSLEGWGSLRVFEGSSSPNLELVSLNKDNFEVNMSQSGLEPVRGALAV